MNKDISSLFSLEEMNTMNRTPTEPTLTQGDADADLNGTPRPDNPTPGATEWQRANGLLPPQPESAPQAEPAGGGAVATVYRGGSKTFGRATILQSWEPGAALLPDGAHKLYTAPQQSAGAPPKPESAAIALLCELRAALSDTYSMSPEGRAYLKRMDAALPPPPSAEEPKL